MMTSPFPNATNGSNHTHLLDEDDVSDSSDDGDTEDDFLVVKRQTSFDDDEDDEESSARSFIHRDFSRTRRCTGRFLLHTFCLVVYLLPMRLPHPYIKGNAVLDELHIVASENRDVNAAETTLEQIFTNDYWGRPMNGTSSHKSWRPLSVLSFRHLKGGNLLNDLTSHRLVNVVTHAAVAELVGILAVKLLPMHVDKPLLRIITKVLFLLHPTHVEVTANAANRPHLLALLASVLLSNADLYPLLFLFTLFCGYLSCETFLFQIVPAAVTLTAMVYIRLYHGPQQVRKRRGIWKQLWTVIQVVWWRVALLGGSGIFYYWFRHKMDWLSIPEGLIRPAENPFYSMVGEERLRNYIYVVAVHVAKAWDLDVIGFSHEYGRACIEPIDDWKDPRMALPAAMVAVLFIVTIFLLANQRRRSVIGMPVLLFLVNLSWMVTLFPISGIVKVGTFIADRIVVASTVPICILVAHWLSSWIRMRVKASGRWKLILLSIVAMFMWYRIHQRTIDWMDSKMLLESSIVTCPRFAKAHLETSKIYSGLYPELLNLTKSRWHLNQVEIIDPDFCDVHQQFAIVAIQENNPIEFEERLVKSLLCPFTMGAALPMWQNYWEPTLKHPSNTPALTAVATARYEGYMKIINQAIQDDEKSNSGRQQQSQSPLVGAWVSVPATESSGNENKSNVGLGGGMLLMAWWLLMGRGNS